MLFFYGDEQQREDMNIKTHVTLVPPMTSGNDAVIFTYKAGI